MKKNSETIKKNPEEPWVALRKNERPRGRHWGYIGNPEICTDVTDETPRDLDQVGTEGTGETWETLTLTLKDTKVTFNRKTN